jgi:2-phospho-L-lactate guanylyltransferase
MTTCSTARMRELIDLRDGWCAVVPQKAFAQAKSRIALPAATRRILAAAMLRDTVAALEATPAVRRVVVVWDDPADTGTLPETDMLHHLVATGLGLNGSIERGSTRARQLVPGTHVVVVPSDLPAIEPVELDTFLRRAGGHRRAFVADTDGIGTSLLSATGDSPLLASYGVGSRDRHRQSGAYDLTRDDLPSLRRDVDDLAALAIVLALGRGVHTITTALGVDALNVQVAAG